MKKTTFLFAQDSYDTPKDARKSLVFKLLFHCRWYFYARNFWIFSRTSKLGYQGKLTKEEQISHSNGNVRLVERCGGRIHLRGMNNLRDAAGQPVVFVGNHMSLLETALFHAIVREYFDFTFVIKQSLMNTPGFGGIMHGLEAIPVGRSNPRDDLRAVLTEGKERLGRGRSVVIFPQHTRSAEFDPAKFNTIGVKLAKSAGVKVIPFALKTDFLGTGKYLRDLGPVRPQNDIWFEFAPARAVEGNGAELHQEIIEFISDRQRQWKQK